MDNEVLKLCLALYVCFGLSFAFAELVELVTHRLICFFTKTECEYRGKIVYVYALCVFFLWPVVLLSMILQIFFKKTYARIRLWVDRLVSETKKENGSA